MVVRKNMLIDCEELACVHSIPESAGRQYTVGTLAVADLGHRMKTLLQPFLIPLSIFLGPPYSALAPPLPCTSSSPSSYTSPSLFLTPAAPSLTPAAPSLYTVQHFTKSLLEEHEGHTHIC